MVYAPLRRALLFLGLLFWPLATPGDAGSMAAWRCDVRHQDCHSIYIVSNRWHAGIVTRRNEISPKTLPEIADFPNAERIEVSWGDQDYFPDPDAGVYAALRAAFRSGGSVLHLVAFNGAVTDFYRDATVKELRLSKTAFARLLVFIAGTFSRPDPAIAAKPIPGLFTYSQFYKADGKFSFARTCNTWVAEALSHAGLPIDAASVITAGQLNAQIAQFAAPM